MDVIGLLMALGSAGVGLLGLWGGEIPLTIAASATGVSGVVMFCTHVIREAITTSTDLQRKQPVA